MSNHNSEIFVFDGRTKLFTIALMAIGVLCLVLSYFSGTPDMHHLRFWTNFLHNSVFFAGIAFTAVLFLACHALAWGGWVAVIKRVPEAMMYFLFVGIILFGIMSVALYFNFEGTELLYLWNNQDYLNPKSANFDALAFHKSAFVNPFAYFLTVVVLAAWGFFAVMFRKISLSEDNTPYTISSSSTVPENVRKNRIYAAAFLPIAGFSSAYVIWQWVMSVDTHWYSTLFAWYCTVSLFVSMVSFTFLIILFLRTKGLMNKFTDEHMHDLGKYIFGFSVFWTYLWFSQFMLIWYSNNGEETQYFYLRFEQFKPIFFANLILNFVAPFLVLMMNTSKRTVGTLGFVAGLVILGHWIDFYQMIKPGVWYNYEHKMHLLHQGGHGDAHSSTSDENKTKAVLTLYEGEEGDQDKDGPAGHEDGHAGHEDGHAGHEDGHAGHEDGHAGHEDGHAGHEDGHAGHEDGHAGHEDGHAEHEDGHAEHEDHHEVSKFEIGVHIPGFLEFGCFAGFLGLFLFVTFSVMSRASLYPPNDPYILESEHYDTGIGPDRDQH